MTDHEQEPDDKDNLLRHPVTCICCSLDTLNKTHVCDDCELNEYEPESIEDDDDDDVMDFVSRNLYHGHTDRDDI